jgi:hypothetical protein
VCVARSTAKPYASATKLQAREQQTKNEKLVRETVFTVNGQPINIVSEFKYLGRILDNNDSDWPAVKRAIQRARMTWGRLCRILSSKRATPEAMASIYRAVVQAVLLYGAESWVLTDTMECALQSFYHRCARYITRQHIRQDQDGNWICPPSKDVLAQAKLLPIQDYIAKRRNTVKRYITTRPIYKQCVESRPLARHFNQSTWWQKLPSGEVPNTIAPNT